jgi:endonuclease-8
VPEGDAVWRTARRLDRALTGAPLVHGDLRWPSLATADLRGATTLEVVSRGKHLLQRFDDGRTLHSHLRMDGRWRLDATAQQAAKPLRHHAIRAVLATERWTAVGWQLGMLDLVPTAEESSLVGHLGPDLLGADWDLEAALARLRALPVTPLGAALLDQRNLAGLGTIYTAETLFCETQQPWQPVAEVPPSRLRAVVERARRLLDAGRAHGIPTTTRVRRRGQGLYVYGRAGRPCRRCGGTVLVEMIGEPPKDRMMFYCPTCQGPR